MPITFTKESIAALEERPKTYTVFDEVEPGFFVRVRGKYKDYHVSVLGKQEYIGSARKISVETARKKAQDIKKQRKPHGRIGGGAPKLLLTVDVCTRLLSSEDTVCATHPSIRGFMLAARGGKSQYVYQRRLKGKSVGVHVASAQSVTFEQAEKCAGELELSLETAPEGFTNKELNARLRATRRRFFGQGDDTTPSWMDAAE